MMGTFRPEILLHMIHHKLTLSIAAVSSPATQKTHSRNWVLNTSNGALGPFDCSLPMTSEQHPQAACFHCTHG